SLNTAASPSPRSTTPASSPGPTRTAGPYVGSFRRWTALDLYEQCSDHITEYIASSARLGSRPRVSTTRSYSSSVRPSDRWSGSESKGATVVSATLSADPLEGPFEERLEQRLAPGGAGVGVDGVLGVRHEPDDVAPVVAEPGDRVRCA